MKNTSKILTGMFLSLFLFTSCEQFKEAGEAREIKSLSAVVTVNLNIGNAPTPESFNVRLINYEERFEVTTTVSANSSVKIGNLIPGIYTVTASSEMSKDGFTYNYSGNVVNIDIVNDNKEIDIEIGSSKSGALIMKEIFYCGSRTPTGGSYFRDQFYEIYNNSEDVQNVKGLCIALLNPNTATANLPIWPGDDASDFVYASSMWQVPLDKDYLLNPGESIIIAQMADNHKKINLNPSSPVDLLSAEFETLVKTTSLISDNPAINMQMAFWPKQTPQWLTTVFGGAFVIYIPSEVIDPSVYVSPIGRTDQNYKIRIDEVIDAVELVGNANQVQLKRVPSVLDAGAATVGGTYLSKSVARKIKTTLPDGRIIYYDTNNSSDDFAVMDVPEIRRNGAMAPLWNNWK
ncbi:MAG: hypothetical protein ACD_77C00227G0005 [uncultured bacterium]|nr:MAG: hypothetical protein ACD_77C00227G0005 [uncultured bacterium]HBY02577.1 DUF4876 domain-containing protein [Rikenellaceae bacterium]